MSSSQQEPDVTTSCCQQKAVNSNYSNGIGSRFTSSLVPPGRLRNSTYAYARPPRYQEGLRYCSKQYYGC
eukprot:scaffold9137_cov35-Attheya_sp.AAC.1